MKTKLLTAFATLLLLAACSSDPAPTSKEPSPTPEHTTPATSATPTDPPAQQIEVDKNLLSVEITLPASMFAGQDLDQVIASAKADGVSEVTKNEDGSITYKMPKSLHNEMMAEMEKGIVEYVDELKTSEDYASIKDVKHNEKFTEFNVIVDKEAFEGSFDGFATLGLGMQGMIYQSFDGSKDNKVTINVKDETSGEIISTAVYPDALNQ